VWVFLNLKSYIHEDTLFSFPNFFNHLWSAGDDTSALGEIQAAIGDPYGAQDERAEVADGSA
jgi:hypothetical protein